MPRGRIERLHRPSEQKCTFLAYWRLDNYLRDLDEGAGFNFNSRQDRLHSAIEAGETLWLFTAFKNPPRYYLAAKLTIRSKTINPPGYKYGDYRVWGGLRQSRYFRLRPDEPGDEAFELLRRLPLVTGTMSDRTRVNLPQACQTIRGLTPEGHALLERFSAELRTEGRAVQVADEYELEHELINGGHGLEELLVRHHVGPSDDRRQRLLALPARNRQLVSDLYDRYSGRCQLCAFDSPVVNGTRSAEAHDVVYLSRGGEDALFNMVLLCPNHHTVIHSTDATLDYSRLTFCFPNGRVEPLCLNSHLTPRLTTGSPEPSSPTSPSPLTATDIATIVALVVNQLTPDFLTPEWAALRRPGDHPLTGYCYVASEAIYHLAGGRSSGLYVYRCPLPTGGSHWWLADTAGTIIDATAEQFAARPPYESGTRASFLTQQPSRRAETLIARVRAAMP